MRVILTFVLIVALPSLAFGDEKADFVNQSLIPDDNETDATFYLHSQMNRENGIRVTKTNISTVEYFDSNKTIVFITHGWLNSVSRDEVVQIRDGLLKSYAVIVITVDWSKFAYRDYVTAQKSVVKIGKIVGAFIDHLVATLGVDLTKVILIAQSLGAHVFGNAGAAVNGQVSTIVGLDPAKPLFTYNNTDNRLDATDAEYVYVIHTCGSVLGFPKPIGHCDYFPNGGNSQPGCGLDIGGLCSHQRAYQYYAESLNSTGFVGYLCDNYQDYKAGKCKNNKKAPMGTFNFDKSIQGSYYLDTNSRPPYAKG